MVTRRARRTVHVGSHRPGLAWPRPAVCCLVAAAVLATVVACVPGARETTRQSSGDEFAIYLLAEDVKSAALLTADPNAVRLDEKPIISTGDIRSYDASTHEIRLTSAAYQRILELFTVPVDTDGLPFAVCAGGGPVYLGAFWTPLSSLSFDGVVIMQPMTPETDTIRIELGYPGPDLVIMKDPRSDERILQALRRAGKLKE